MNVWMYACMYEDVDTIMMYQANKAWDMWYNNRENRNKIVLFFIYLFIVWRTWIVFVSLHLLLMDFFYNLSVIRYIMGVNTMILRMINARYRQSYYFLKLYPHDYFLWEPSETISNSLSDIFVKITNTQSSVLWADWTVQHERLLNKMW